MTLPSVDDRRLLAEVLRWARSHGWSSRWPEMRRNGMWAWANATWPRLRPPAHAVRVTFDGRTVQVTKCTDSGWYAVATTQPASVVQAVDVLVALDILPPFLSSSYALAVDRHAELIECLEEDLARRDHLLRTGDQTIAGLIEANTELRAAAARAQFAAIGGVQ